VHHVLLLPIELGDHVSGLAPFPFLRQSGIVDLLVRGRDLLEGGGELLAARGLLLGKVRELPADVHKGGVKRSERSRQRANGCHDLLEKLRAFPRALFIGLEIAVQRHERCAHRRYAVAQPQAEEDRQDDQAEHYAVLCEEVGRYEANSLQDEGDAPENETEATDKAEERIARAICLCSYKSEEGDSARKEGQHRGYTDCSRVGEQQSGDHPCQPRHDSQDYEDYVDYPVLVPRVKV